MCLILSLLAGEENMYKFLFAFFNDPREQCDRYSCKLVLSLNAYKTDTQELLSSGQKFFECKIIAVADRLRGVRMQFGALPGA